MTIFVVIRDVHFIKKAVEVKVLPDNYNKYYIDLGALWERKIQSYGLYN